MMAWYIVGIFACFVTLLGVFIGLREIKNKRKNIWNIHLMFKSGYTKHLYFKIMSGEIRVRCDEESTWMNLT